MNVSNKLQKIRLILAQNGFVAILEKMPPTPVTFVEGNCITGQQPAHHIGNGNRAGLEEKMKMIGNQCPGETARLGFIQKLSQTIRKSFPVDIVAKNLPLRNPSGYHMMQRTWRIYPSLAGHVVCVPESSPTCKLRSKERPSFPSGKNGLVSWQKSVEHQNHQDRR